MYMKTFFFVCYTIIGMLFISMLLFIFYSTINTETEDIADNVANETNNTELIMALSHARNINVKIRERNPDVANILSMRIDNLSSNLKSQNMNREKIKVELSYFIEKIRELLGSCDDDLKKELSQLLTLLNTSRSIFSNKK
ncbi:hypothetical protein SLOPH_2207 [Spraguea lophii 42_110]|uniref:Uncharacterized protein n=1 Tax=Spraguea lophii (strain 42_110) TaxID=1358809 RepID=S7XQ99_SPRLO|nr:hypothetical protein SLOPH_2207 [Spraguea lophii 42_110]